MAKMNTVIVADSRGGGLQDIIHDINTRNHRSDQVTVLSYSGQGFHGALTRALPTLWATQPDLVILMLGICDLTTRNKTTRVTTLRHTNLQDIIKGVIVSARLAVARLQTSFDCHISLATLTGVDLTDYNFPHRKFMTQSEYNTYCSEIKTAHPNQDLLNQAVVEINRQLTEINKSNSTPTAWTGSLVHSYYKKRHHHYYKRLYDGCHPDLTTKKAWAHQLCKSIWRILPTDT